MFVFVAGCAAPTGPSLAFDPCQATFVAAPDASPEQLDSIDSAIAMWQGLGVSVARAEPAQVSIEFRPGAQPLYGFYEEATATIYINRNMTDSVQRAVTVAHELGHAFALEHVAANVRESVMNPGNVTREPNASDRAELAQTWGPCVTRNAGL